MERKAALPVPAQDRLRLHDMETLPPTVRPQAAKPDPQDPIQSPDAGTRVGAQSDLELMPDDKVLEGQIPVRSNGSDERAKHKEE